MYDACSSTCFTSSLPKINTCCKGIFIEMLTKLSVSQGKLKHWNIPWIVFMEKALNTPSYKEINSRNGLLVDIKHLNTQHPPHPLKLEWPLIKYQILSINTWVEKLTCTSYLFLYMYFIYMYRLIIYWVRLLNSFLSLRSQQPENLYKNNPCCQ